MKCPHCGNDLFPRQFKCEKCGNIVPENFFGKDKEEEKKENKTVKEKKAK